MDDFYRALNFTLQWEGGIDRGISQGTFSTWLEERGLPDRSVREITRSEVEGIYRDYYWRRAFCDRLPYPLNVVMFDTAVQFGVAGAIEFLQEALGVRVDGYWGQETEAVLKKAVASDLAVKICDSRYRYRMDRVMADPTQRGFLNGWHSRDKALKELVMGKMNKTYRKITAIQDTWIKRSGAMASTLGANEKVAYRRGESLEGVVLATDKNHTIVELKEPRFGFYNWHLFTAHWDLVPPAIKLDVPFYPQTDNYTQPDRTCNSSACAMFAKYFGAPITGDDDYLRRVLAIGDTTDHGVQTIVLQQLGIPSRWRTDLDFVDLDRELENRRPIVIGILHRGTDYAPYGGHMIVVVGKDRNNYLCHDPYGNLYDGYTSPVENGKFVKYNRKTLERRWLVEGSRSGWGRVYGK